MHSKNWLALASSLSVGAIAFAGTATADVGIDDIVADQTSAEDIVSYGLGPRGQRYRNLNR